jgi:hypothetical protein
MAIIRAASRRYLGFLAAMVTAGAAIVSTTIVLVIIVAGDTVAGIVVSAALGLFLAYILGGIAFFAFAIARASEFHIEYSACTLKLVGGTETIELTPQQIQGYYLYNNKLVIKLSNPTIAQGRTVQYCPFFRQRRNQIVLRTILLAISDRLGIERTLAHFDERFAEKRKISLGIILEWFA